MKDNVTIWNRGDGSSAIYVNGKLEDVISMSSECRVVDWLETTFTENQTIEFKAPRLCHTQEFPDTLASELEFEGIVGSLSEELEAAKNKRRLAEYKQLVGHIMRYVSVECYKAKRSVEIRELKGTLQDEISIAKLAAYVEAYTGIEDTLKILIEPFKRELL